MSNGSARRVTGVVAAAMIVALAIWALARLLGVELTVGNGQDASHVSAADVVVTALLAGLVGWVCGRSLPAAGPIDPGHLSAAPRWRSPSSDRSGLPTAWRAWC
jgi:hypothetical protein